MGGWGRGRRNAYVSDNFGYGWGDRGQFRGGPGGVLT